MRASTIQLNETQETDLTEYVRRRIQELERDNRDRIKADKKADTDYRNQKKSRAQPGTLFEQSNFSVPLTSWVVDHFSARTEDELLSRDPIVRFQPQGTADDEVARGVHRLACYKLFDQGTVKHDLQKAIYPMFAHRALILKSVYKEEFNEWEEYDLEVLHDRATGQPIEILGHGYIVKGVDTFTQVIDMATEQPVLQLDADPSFRVDLAQHFFQRTAGAVRYKERLFAAPASVQVDSDRFLCPNDARSLNEADALGEKYDKNFSWVMERFTERPWYTAKQYLAELQNETADRKTKSTRSDLSKESLLFDTVNKRVEIVELWLTRDVLGWGRPQKIVVWFDVKRKKLISYDFQVKMMPQGRQPFTAIAIWQQDDVWWGYSIPEMLEPVQDYLDTQFNRHTHRNAINSTPIVGEHSDAIDGNQSFASLRPFDVVPLAAGKRMSDWIETFTLPKTDVDTEELIDKAIYWVNFWLGISNIARGDYSDVPQNTTLGGQEATLKEASKLSRRWTRRVIIGLQEHLTTLVRLMLATMDEFEAYTFLEGDQRQLAVLEAARVRDLLIDARLVWNSEQTSRTIETNRLSLEIVEKYATYLATAPWMIPMIRPLLKSSLFMLGHDNVDELLPLPPFIPPMPIMAPAPLGGVTAEPGAPAAPGEPAPVDDGGDSGMMGAGAMPMAPVVPMMGQPQQPQPKASNA